MGRRCSGFFCEVFRNPYNDPNHCFDILFINKMKMKMKSQSPLKIPSSRGGDANNYNSQAGTLFTIISIVLLGSHSCPRGFNLSSISCGTKFTSFFIVRGQHNLK